MSLMVGAHHSSSGSCSFSSDMMVSDESKKHNHSEIEKRRRDKMNHYITELSCLIPMCNAMSRKLDKLTVLRMAVQHMKTIKGSMNALAGAGQMKPTFLSDEALLKLISQISEGFLFVVSCDRGRILFVSESVSQILNYSQSDLLGQNWFDILHPKDVAKVKEQLSSSDLSPKERLIDAKTMLPVKSSPAPSNQISMSPGARRSFFCRMKFKSMPRVKEEADTTTGYAQKRRKSQSSDRKYCVVHCIGYLKSWISTKMSITEDTESETDIYNMSCLVAIGRTLPNLTVPTPFRTDIQVKPMSFTSRNTIDGKFLFVDQRATLILGYLPQELLGTCCYEYCHHEDLKILAESHRLGLEASGDCSSKSARYRFKTKSGPYICLQTTWKTFRNPWTKEFEFLLAVNSCVSDIDVVESSGDGESRGEAGRYVTPGWKTSSTVDEILFRISDSCRNKANKSGHNGGGGGGNGGGGGSSNEQSSTGYSSTDTRSVQKMLASSRVALWKIGRYIADEVLENQRRNEDSNCLSPSSYPSSPTPTIDGISFTSDSGIDRLAKWRPEPSRVSAEMKQLALNASHTPESISSMWLGVGPLAGIASNQRSLSMSSHNDMNIAAAAAAAVAVSAPSTVSASCPRLSMETDSPVLHGPIPPAVYQQQQQHENLFDPLVSGNEPRGPSTSGPQPPPPPLPPPARASTSARMSALSCIEGTPEVNYYRNVSNEASGASLPTLTEETSNETGPVHMDEAEATPTPTTVAQYSQVQGNDDQENEDAAMDLIMSILEADAGLGGPVDPSHTPCPWF